MRKFPPSSRLRLAFKELQATPRRLWLTTFVLVTLLSGLWSVANPPLAGPDEPAHVIRAVAVDHGDVTGKKPTGRVERKLRRVEASTRVVQAPEVYRRLNGPPCFALNLGPAACLNFKGGDHNAEVATYAALEPPAYYAAVGVVSWLFTSGPASVYGMRSLGVLLTAAFIATAVTAVHRSAHSKLLITGLLLAITPMVLFTSSVVNPSAPEIASALAFWACALVLLTGQSEKPQMWLVNAAGIAACVLVLSRPFGPLWMALIVLTGLCLANGAALRNLARSGAVRLWGAAIIAASCVQIGWNVLVGVHDATLVNRRSVGLAIIEPFVETGTAVRWFREMIGRFGWLDTQAPAPTWLLWTAALAFVFFLALAWVDRRRALVLLGLLGAVILVPVLIESTPYGSAETYWQGRYILPLAVGVPIVAAFALESTDAGRQLVNRRFAWTVGIALGAAQFLAYAQNLRRYAVGYDGPITFWANSDWVPPLPSLLLTAAYAGVLVVFLSFLLTGATSPVRPSVEERERMRV